MGRKIDPRGTKIDVKMEVKFNRFLKASWKAKFSAKRRAKRPRDAPKVRSDAESAGRGEDYGGVHKTKFQGDLIRTLHKNLI